MFKVVDELIGRRIVVRNRFGRGKLRENAVGELFAELNTPLIERIDIPDDALDEDLVFVHGNEETESVGSETRKEKAVGRTIAREYFLRGDLADLLGGHVGIFEFFDNLIE